jgi:peptidoglycan/xylan/chitin deacetylase (PgdA/CDA1 family)
VRSALRLLAEHLLDGSGLTSLALQSRKGGRLILAFHNVVPDDAPRIGDQALHLPLSTFRSVLDECAAVGDIVPLSNALHDELGEGERPRITITFDDAYQGCLRHALPELQRRRLPATVFVAPGILGGRTMWWDAIAEPKGLSPETRDKVLNTHAGYHIQIHHDWRARDAAWATLPDDWQTAHEAQVKAALDYDQLRLAPHSWNHRNLTRCSDRELGEELQRPVEWLAAFAGERCLTSVLAYPYGLHDERVVTAAGSASYAQALRVDGGWWKGATPPPLRIPRLNVPAGITRRGFRLRLAGLLQ